MHRCLKAGGFRADVSVNPAEFPTGFPSTTPAKWQPVYAQSPYGPIVAHYTVFADDPINPYRDEKFLTITNTGTMSAMSGRKIVERLPLVDHCFIVFTDGQRVLFNKRYTPDTATRAAWNKVAQQTADYTGEMDTDTFKMAVQWHMNNFDMNRVRA